jgi:hypothetical protein
LHDGDLPVSVPIAHVGGLPVEETLPALASAWAASAYMTARFLAWLRRR